MSAPRLERIAADAEKLVLAMPEADRERASAGLRMVITGAQLLMVLPEAMTGHLWNALVTFVLKMQLPGARPRVLFGQLADGAPRLIGPWRAEVEKELE